ncbi:MAG: hypothetical protein JWL72_3074 [Ilumatobacteraceae bacterium]|nr:hypothetical protein [Ilumatobacteraceae bacterium]MCU1389736.1 hypothetical protein [Ilumatobacteraceae bacterium]
MERFIGKVAPTTGATSRVALATTTKPASTGGMGQV